LTQVAWITLRVLTGVVDAVSLVLLITPATMQAIT
jgi:hypothetical protein